MTSGEVVEYIDTTVTGLVSLKSVDVVRMPFRCIDCTFTGLVDIRDVIFERVVDFTGTIFDEGITADSAIFESAAVFRGAYPAGEAQPKLASFDNVLFGDVARFDTARFTGAARFTEAVFAEDALFRFATFSQEADFDQATVGGDARFEGATFHSMARFFGVSVSGTLALHDVHIGGCELTEEKTATDGDVGCQGLLLLGDDKMELGSLEMPLRLQHALLANPNVDVSHREAVLLAVEETALSNGDLKLANDATFARVSIDSDPIEFLFGRLIAGYTVKPVHPLVSILVLLVVGTIARVTLSRSGPIRRPDWLHGVAAFLRPWSLAARSSWANVRGKEPPDLTAPRRDDDESNDKGAGDDATRRPGRNFAEVAEFVTFAVLLVLFIIALANSNRVARDIVDSLF